MYKESILETNLFFLGRINDEAKKAYEAVGYTVKKFKLEEIFND